MRQFWILLAVLIVLDGLWLGLLMRDFYRDGLAHLARMADGRLDPIWPVAVLVYPVIALGLAVFALPRAATAVDCRRRRQDERTMRRGRKHAAVREDARAG